ncbi:MAG TPA: thioredoxin domain-containing protein [Candidatus Binatia bacterium]|nr:thioredoxin domain-containing protein [Candidatus Binatia bacterium]
MDKRFLGILAAIVVIFVGIVAVSKHSDPQTSSSSSSTQPTHHVEGTSAANVTLMEYGDFECPICGSYYEPLKQAQAQFGSVAYFQFRNLPLVSIHPNAFAGARAAEAAALQGNNQFWRMHDLLYQNQTEWANSSDVVTIFNRYASELQLNVDKFKKDYASSQVNDSINADLNAFSKTGQDEATPTFFLDGKYIPNTEFTNPQTGAPDPAKIVAVVNAEVAKKSKTQ